MSSIAILILTVLATMFAAMSASPSVALDANQCETYPPRQAIQHEGSIYWLRKDDCSLTRLGTTHLDCHIWFDPHHGVHAFACGSELKGLWSNSLLTSGKAQQSKASLLKSLKEDFVQEGSDTPIALIDVGPKQVVENAKEATLRTIRFVDGNHRNRIAVILETTFGCDRHRFISVARSGRDVANTSKDMASLAVDFDESAIDPTVLQSFEGGRMALKAVPECVRRGLGSE